MKSLIVWLFTALPLCMTSETPHLFLFTHGMSTSHLDVVFNIARMVDEIAWKGGEETLRLLELLISNVFVFLMPCDFKETIPVNENITSTHNLALIDPFSLFCYVARARALRSDFIFVAPLIEPSTKSILSGAPLPFSYSTSLCLPKSLGEMHFMDRFANVFCHQIFRSALYHIDFARYLFDGSTKGVFNAIEPTMFAENSHRFIDWPIPTTRAQVRFGSPRNTVSSNEQFSLELKSFLSKPFRGFIVFSMSTFVSNGKMPNSIINLFSNVFARFPDYGFIWRIDELPKKYMRANIHSQKWLPQRKLLGNERVVLLISHCGQNSFLEAIQSGVPILGIPQVADQFVNGKRLGEFSLGIQLIKEELNAERLSKAILTLLEHPKYKRRVTAIQRMMNTEEEFGMVDDVKWWTHYRLRHGHTTFKKWIIPNGANFTLFFYYCCDLFIPIAILILILTAT